jgi:hypothetical protein
MAARGTDADVHAGPLRLLPRVAERFLDDSQQLRFDHGLECSLSQIGRDIQFRRDAVDAQYNRIIGVLSWPRHMKGRNGCGHHPE